MSTCKEINFDDNKRSVFDVRIDISDCPNSRNQIADDLKNLGWDFATELAKIIEKG